MLLEVKGGSTANKASVQLATNARSSAQMWKISHDENGYVTDVTVKNLKSGLVLDVAGGSYLLISALSPDLAIDLKGGKTAAGTNVQLYLWNDSKAQMFKFEEV